MAFGRMRSFKIKHTKNKYACEMRWKQNYEIELFKISKVK